MKRRFCSLILTLALCLSILPAPVFAAPGFLNFSAVKDYNGQFTDVPSGEWYAESVASAYRLGLVAGKTTTEFCPKDNLKISEVIALACAIHATYNETTVPAVSEGHWYQRYVNYAKENGILTTAVSDYERSATRAECMMILANSLPEEAFAEINHVETGAIPDVPVNATYASAVYKFYRAGILAGYENGEFRPTNPIRRCEIAATLLRLADPNIRGAVNLPASTTLNAEQIAQKCASAVFYIEVYDAYGEWLSSGSGFFIDPSGVAVTNYHVIDEAYSAKVMLTNGSVYDVEGVYDYDVDRDIALLQIDGSGFDALPLGDSSRIAAGQTVFAIGSPQGFDNSISQGIIANVSREIDGEKYIQMTAQISPGNSGGALLNDKGYVVGIPSMIWIAEYSQSINFAIPINDINMLSRGSVVTLASIAGGSGGDPYQSSDYFLVPDYDDLTLAADSGYEITIYTDGPFETISYTVSDTNVITCSWGEWNDDGSIPLTIYTWSKGTATIRLDLLDAYDSVILSRTVTVGVIDRAYNSAFSVTQTGVNLTVGQTATVTMTQYISDYVVAHWECWDTGVAGCEWGAWTGTTTLPLYITGRSAGSTIVAIDLYAEGQYVGSKKITVTVSGGN